MKTDEPSMSLAIDCFLDDCCNCWHVCTCQYTYHANCRKIKIKALAILPDLSFSLFQMLYCIWWVSAAFCHWTVLLLFRCRRFWQTLSYTTSQVLAACDLGALHDVAIGCLSQKMLVCLQVVWNLCKVRSWLSYTTLLCSRRKLLLWQQAIGGLAKLAD